MIVTLIFWSTISAICWSLSRRPSQRLFTPSISHSFPSVVINAHCPTQYELLLLILKWNVNVVGTTRIWRWILIDIRKTDSLSVILNPTKASISVRHLTDQSIRLIILKMKRTAHTKLFFNKLHIGKHRREAREIEQFFSGRGWGAVNHFSLSLTCRSARSTI